VPIAAPTAVQTAFVGGLPIFYDVEKHLGRLRRMLQLETRTKSRLYPHCEKILAVVSPTAFLVVGSGN
jgi:hypothetical protein